MPEQPHPESRSVACAVVTVSDTRDVTTDSSGQLIQALLDEAGHRLVNYSILKDEPGQIRSQVQTIVSLGQAEAIILNGGTGIAPRDTTYDAIEHLIEKPLPGFGEIFRWLSYQEIGSRAIASRATAGIYRSCLLFSLPGSSNAVRLAMTTLVLPELPHLVSQLRQ